MTNLESSGELNVENSAERPLVTFALISFNQERYISRALQGALEQDYDNLEIIVSDDASTDKTIEIIEKVLNAYAGPHKVLVNFNKVNHGIGAHVNKINSLASGDLVVMAAGDDISNANRVSTLVSRWLKEGRPSALCSQAIVISENGDTLSTRFHGYDGIYPRGGEHRLESIVRLLREDHCILLGCTEAWGRVVFEKFGNLGNHIVHEDNVMSLRAWLVDQIVFIDEALVEYRTHDKNVAFEVYRIPTTVEDFRRRELGLSNRQRNKVGNLDQYATDVQKAYTLGLITYNELHLFGSIISSRKYVHWMKAVWWDLSIRRRLVCIFECISKRNFLGVLWALPRWLGLGIFSRSRYIVAFLSRLRRRLFQVLT